MDVRKIIGWNLRALRVERSLSQERLALEAGIDRSYIGRVERGSENVTVNSLESMARVLDVHVRRLFDEPASEEVPPPLPSGRKRKDTT